jgi:predicted adenine nucleotide alpha hydrolase (AANH) superfamily ATPase
VQCTAQLIEEGIKPVLFWYNPNIHPYTEYRSRRDTLKQYAGEERLGLVMEDCYGVRMFIAGLYAEPLNPADTAPRCAFCYRLRLEACAVRAAAEGYAAFGTTLLISPYQNHELIKRTGEALAEKHRVEFLYRDFRPRFRRGQEEARSRQFYMQKYCGCIFSEEERYLSREADKKNIR